MNDKKYNCNKCETPEVVVPTCTNYCEYVTPAKCVEINTTDIECIQEDKITLQDLAELLLCQQQPTPDCPTVDDGVWVTVVQEGSSTSLFLQKTAVENEFNVYSILPEPTVNIIEVVFDGVNYVIKRRDLLQADIATKSPINNQNDVLGDYILTQSAINLGYESLEITCTNPNPNELPENNCSLDVTIVDDTAGNYKATATGGTPPYTYNFQVNGGDILGNSSGDAFIVTSGSIGLLKATATDDDGCKAEEYYLILNTPDEG
jgi:hypothetical protein